MLRDWKMIHKEGEDSRLELLAEALERRGSELGRITWDPGWGSSFDLFCLRCKLNAMCSSAPVCVWTLNCELCDECLL
jgi:hypothetical protein